MKMKNVKGVMAGLSVLASTINLGFGSFLA
jgi:hypothetical protein